MANKRVTDLPQAEKMLDGDILHIIQNGTDKQIPANKVGGGGVKQGTRAEIDAMILSGEIEEGDSYIVNDEEAMYNPADLNDIRALTSTVIPLPYIPWDNLPSRSIDTETYCREWVDYMENKFANVNKTGKVLIGGVNPNLQGWVVGYSSNLSLKFYSNFTVQLYGASAMYTFGYDNNSWFFVVK